MGRRVRGNRSALSIRTRILNELTTDDRVDFHTSMSRCLIYRKPFLTAAVSAFEIYERDGF